MKVGFTGTQFGMTERQKKTFQRICGRYRIDEFHHGDCVGADFDANTLIGRTPDFLVVIHPPTNSSKRAFCNIAKILPKKPYLERNHDIVDQTHIMIATPKQNVEQLRSGTWATIRYALKRGRKVFLILPSGLVKIL